MTRQAGANRPRSNASRDPYGIGPVAGFIAPVVALVGLVIIAAMTLGLFNGQLPFKPVSTASGGNGGAGGNSTPAPSNVVVTPPEVVFPGSIVYAKAGNIWAQDGTNVRQLTNSGHDSMPSFSPDGTSIYFIRIEDGQGRFPTEGHKAVSTYDLATPVLMRMKADGTGEVKLLTGRYRQGSQKWFFWLRQPVPSPDGKTVSVISDGPNPLQSDIVLKSFSLGSKKLTAYNLPESLHLGHQDPAWRPDGRYLLYVMNARDGARGAPQIFRYDTSSKKTRALTGPGYLAPAWAPDGQFFAATKTDAFGTDIAILDGSGTEVLRVTNDSHSFAPVWSPAGDAVAFLHLAGTGVDLWMAKLDFSTGHWTVTSTTELTTVSGLDGSSRPTWFVPGSAGPAASPPPGSPSAGAGSPSIAP